MLISISATTYEQRRFNGQRATVYRSSAKEVRVAPDTLFKIRRLNNGGAFLEVDDQRIKLNPNQADRLMERSTNPRKRTEVPRKKLIDGDPVKHAKGLRIPELVALLKKLDKAYHDTGKPLVPDPVYDALKDVLEERSPNNKYLKEVGAIPDTQAAKRVKVQLPNYMPSLNKVKLGARGKASILDWAADHPGPYIVSDKLDGISLLLVYANGEPIKAYTRGNGTIGQDVSALVPMLNIPKNLRRDLTVRAEAMIPAAVFKRKYSVEKAGPEDGFENPRNMSAGLINRLEVGKELRDFKVVIHEVVAPRLTPAKQMQMAKRLGFDVVTHVRVKSLRDDALTKFLDKRRKASPFEMDGLVIRPADETYRPVTSGKPDYAVSFKVDDLESAPTVEVLEVEWRRTRTSYLFPRIVIKGTRIGGVTVHHVSGKNAKFIKDNKIGPGARIKVLRAGDVIPDVVDVVKPAKVVWPDYKFKWSAQKVDIIAVENNDEVHAKQIEHFFTTMGVEGLKLGTVNKLVAAGLGSIAAIVKAKPADFLRAEGIQERTAKKLHQNIQQAVKTATFARTGDASGVFGRTIGTRKLNAVYKKYPDIMNYIRRSPRLLVDMLNQVQGVQTATAQRIAEGLPLFAKFLRESGIRIHKPAQRKGQQFAGQVVVFTGFRDKALQQHIEDQGGEMGSSVTRNTTILVTKVADASSTKVTKANNLGVRVYSLDQFTKRYRL